ncbi:MAG TPA: malate:quinone oxidoreductase [Bacteroidia bacterium]|jgi:malate dehydrogenase (quinone)|nr:malate:quinone oxidoreductase [Bacteroidia bacterium]
MSHFFHIHHKAVTHPDVVLIGTGIMSATLGFILKEIDPHLTIEIYERLDTIAAESSDAWNNAGTGHSAFCELNYTPQHEDGKVDITKALKIAEQFEVSKQFWAYLVEKKYISDPHTFINKIPHLSFVWGDENAAYLKKRFELLTQHPLFSDMIYTEDKKQMEKWFPLMMENRDKNQKCAATRMEIGTDMNFGELTRRIFKHLAAQPGVTLNMNHEVVFLEKKENDNWELEAKNLVNHEKKTHEAHFVFIGAGGGSLPLLEKAEIPEGDGFGGFPVSGQWLVCKNEEVIKKHAAKVYGKAEVGAPPMSVPHLDTRIINGKKALLFGPYAGFSTKFLKHGSLMDLPASLQLDNLIPIVSAGLHNIPLTKYLIDQVRQSPEDRLEALKKFVPTAKMEDWVLEEAGQRVQVIKKDHDHGGVLEFGTEIVNSADGSIAALLGASPGASTAVSIMLDLITRCFKDRVASPLWQDKLKEMIPSFGQSLGKDAELCQKTRERTSRVLDLTQVKYTVPV